MVNAPDGYQFHFDPASYLETIRVEVPAYNELQDAVAHRHRRYPEERGREQAEACYGLDLREGQLDFVGSRAVVC